MKILRRKISAKYRLFNDCLNPKSKIYVNQNQFQREDRSEKEMLFHFKVSKHSCHYHIVVMAVKIIYHFNRFPIAHAND